MENNKKQTLSIPAAIIVAGFIIMVGILITKGGSPNSAVAAKDKTLSEQVGVNKDKFTQCMKDTDLQALRQKTNDIAQNAMKGVPDNERGTPYSVIIGKNGVKTEVRGADSYENVKKLIAEVKAGKVTQAYTGETTGYEEGDHILGNPNASVVIVEYSDLECPYCKRFSPILKQIVTESNGDVAWVYRHWIIHPNALAKAGAAECVAKLNGNDAFWKYVDLVFGLLKTEDDTSGVSQL